MNNLDLIAENNFPDLSFLDASFNLQNYVDVSNQVPDGTLLTDILAKESQILGNTAPVTTLSSVNFGFLKPKSVEFGSDYYGSEEGIKQKPAAGNKTQKFSDSLSTIGYTYAKLHELPDLALNFAVFGGGQREVIFNSEEKESCKKLLDKTSNEYRERRERNNIASRKSREKLRQKENNLKRRFCDLVSENNILRKEVERLSSEVGTLQNLMSKNASPETSAKSINKLF